MPFIAHFGFSSSNVRFCFLLHFVAFCCFSLLVVALSGFSLLLMPIKPGFHLAIFAFVARFGFCYQQKAITSNKRYLPVSKTRKSNEEQQKAMETRTKNQNEQRKQQ